MNVRERPNDDPYFLQQPYKAWRDRVEELLLQDWCIGIEDAGIENWNLYESYADGWTPEYYVNWFSEKYDLIDFRDPSNQLEAVLSLISLILEKDPASK